MSISRPKLFKIFFVSAVSYSCTIVKELVQPNVNGLLFVPGQGQGEFRRAARNGNIFQPLIDKTQHFIFAYKWFYFYFVCFNFILKDFLVFGKFKKPVSLFYEFWLFIMQRT